METFLATEGKKKNGIWYFECPLHGDKPNKWHESNSMIRVLATMKDHMNDNHPGQKARLKIVGDYTVHTTYTAISNVVPKGDIL